MMVERYTADCKYCGYRSTLCANVESARILACQHKHDHGPDHSTFWIIAHVDTYLKEDLNLV